MYYELRTYVAAPGKLEDLQNRFRTYTLGIFEKHQISVVGFWLPDEPDNDTLIYLLSFPDRASAKAAWAAFRSDPAWIEAKAKTEVNGILAAQVISQYLNPTDFSPLK
jgi:hypothetical protein